MRVGFIGTGQMGRPMAANLLRAGHELTAYNRTRARAAALAAAGARVAETPAAAADGAEVLITMLADDAAVEAALFGDDGAFYALAPGAVHACMATVGVEFSRELGRAHAEAGHGYVAAPVFGRPAAAEAAKLWVVAAGAAEARQRCAPLFEALAQGVFALGEEPERASVVKLAGNFLIAAMIEALGEAFVLTRKHGVPPADFLQVVGSLFGSPLYQNYGGLVAEQRYQPPGFALKLGLKDVRLVLQAADAAAAPLPLASLLHLRLLTAVAHGWGDDDWAALARLAAGNAGLETS